MSIRERTRTTTTPEEFYAFRERPENSEKIFELINGEIVEVPSNPFVSEVAQVIGFFIRLFLRQNKLRGHITGEAGGFYVNGQLLAPDVSYKPHDPANPLARKGFNQQSPALAVEVISDPSNSAEQRILRIKTTHYMQAGVILWVVDAEARTVEVHQPGAGASLLEEGDTLTLATLLPGFELPIRAIFEMDETEG